MSGLHQQQQQISRYAKQQEKKKSQFEETKQAWERDSDMAWALKYKMQTLKISMLRAPVDTEENLKG